MKKTVRYLKGGKVTAMSHRYADILVKLKLVEYVDEPSRDFRDDIKRTVITESPVVKGKPGRKPGRKSAKSK